MTTKRERDEERVEELARGFYDPLRFVLWAFPWGESPEFSLVELPEPWASKYPGCKYGPDKWACELLDEVGRQVRDHDFDGRHTVEPVRIAVASGHGIGKGHILSEIIDTPFGRRRFGDLKAGDWVFGADGAPTRVAGIPYRGVRPCYKVVFDDGSSTIVSREHLWNVRGRQERRKGLSGWRTLETHEILELGVKRANGKAVARQWEVPQQGAAQYPEADLPLDPYLVGLLIGNGSLTNHTPRLALSSPEVFQYLDNIVALEDCTVTYAERFVQVSIPDIYEAVREAGIGGKKSNEKGIPDAYKFSSIEQRSELFRGLIDSDGEVSKNGSLIYSTTSRKLADDIVWLTRSLGGKAQIQPTVKQPFYYNERREKVPGLPCYRVTLTMPRGFVCGRYKERVERIKPTVEDRYLTRWIDSIEYVGDFETMCISVEAKDGLYQANDFIVTHNSTLTGMLVTWLLATRPHSKGVVTATTALQLETKTFAEIKKWLKNSIVADMFEVQARSIYAKEAPESWRIDIQTCREENSEAFAGQHSASSSSYYVVDEASGVPDKIWEVCEGGLTDGEPFMFVFGNPTKNSGAFYDCFHRDAARWTKFKVDSREAVLTNKKTIQEWAEAFGEDSDFFKIRVRGEFPGNASTQFIPSAAVEAATLKPAPGLEGNNMKRAIIGLDIARFGDDASVMVTRVGRDAVSIPMKELRKLDGRMVGEALVAHCNYLLDCLKFQEVRVYFDRAGVGAAVWDFLRYEYNDPRVRYTPVDFGSGASNRTLYANRRVEMWGRMKSWLVVEGGVIPNNKDLKQELSAPEYFYNDRQQMLLERKKDLKDRIGCSPDHADALALTFYDANADFTPDAYQNPFRSFYRRQQERDPYAEFENAD